MSALKHTLASIPSRWKKRALVSAGVIGGLWLTGWLAVPPLLKWQLEKQGSELLGRTVTVEKVDFRPWSLELSLEGLSVAQADGKTPQFSVKRLYADAELQSLLRLAPVIDAVSIEQPRVVLRQLEPGHLDIDDVIQRLDKPDDGSPPPRFAVFNIALHEGSVDFTDDTVGQTHELRQLLLTVPFLSNLASRRDVVTEPRLAFTLNDSAFDTHAATTPFAQTHRTQATLRIDGFDLTRYRAYWPKSLPVQLGSGQLQTDLQLEFEQQDTPRVTVSGSVNLDGWQLQEALPGKAAAGSPPALLGWKRLHLAFDKTEPLNQRLRLQQVAWEEPVLNVRRAGNGELHLARIAQALSHPAPSKTASNTPAPSQTGTTPTAPWQVDLAQFQLKGGQVIWQDASTRPAAELALQDLNLSTGRLTWPVQEPVKLDGSVRLQDTPLHWSGLASDQNAQLDFKLDPLPLELARPYAAAALKPELSGMLSAEAQLNWTAAQDQQPAQTQVRLARLALQDVALRSGKKTLAGLKNLLGENIELDLGQQTVNVGKLQIDQPQAQLGRDAQERWAHEAWLVQANPATTKQAATPAGNSNATPWRVSLQALTINDGQGRWDDASPIRPVRLHLSRLNLQSGPLQFPATQAVATPLSVSLRLADATAPRHDPGRIRYQGKLQLPLANQKTATARTSLNTQGSLNIEHLPLHALEPYFAESLNLELLRADTSYRGQFQLGLPPEGLSLQAKGDVAIEDLHASTLSPAEELLDWKALNLRGVNVQVKAGQLHRLNVEETVLSDYYARVIVHPNGRINLQDLVRQTPPQEAAPDAKAATAATPAATAPPGPAVPTSTATAASPTPDIRFGPISLVNGRVNFSDHFIQPNYSANLSELTGSLGSFSNAAPAPGQPPQLAELTLKGRAEGTASLDITGKLNPLSTPLALDIKASARELELPPLSPYTVKYAGHGIERGKLSMDVSYRIEPNGQLSASNQIILNQLRFGERDPNSTAPNLPLKLAVALLADSDGVIDINLPISGSLNDPQFRVGPIIFKLIFNLIGKAITSPFSLIAHALGGGGEELNNIAFAPGSTTLSDVSRQKLDNVAKAMAARPALQLTITGESDLEAERSGYRQTRLNEMLLAEKRRQLARAGDAVSATSSYKQEERSALLKEVYRRADIPKPRNLIGIAKELPDTEMEALLQASIPVTEDAIRELAVTRGTVVKDYLASRQVAPSRMFLGRAKPKRDSTPWEPSSELSLSIGQ
ncbi:MAG TPA: DUF748 domain-containing protein [Macromonas sp.]|nr:DUF748 domain-containing protein [Macromonas sp.]